MPLTLVVTFFFLAPPTSRSRRYLSVVATFLKGVVQMRLSSEWLFIFFFFHMSQMHWSSPVGFQLAARGEHIGAGTVGKTNEGSESFPAGNQK